MKKTSENKTCTLVKGALISLVLNSLIIALGAIYGCSSDGVYDEPWLTKEHKTRAASDMNLMMEPPLPGNFVIEQGNGRTPVLDSVKFTLNIYWDEIDGDSPLLAKIEIDPILQSGQHDKQVTGGPTCTGSYSMHNGAHSIKYDMSYTYKKLQNGTGQWSGDIPRSFSGYYSIPERFIYDHTGDF